MPLFISLDQLIPRDLDPLIGRGPAQNGGEVAPDARRHRGIETVPVGNVVIKGSNILFHADQVDVICIATEDFLSAVQGTLAAVIGLCRSRRAMGANHDIIKPKPDLLGGERHDEVIWEEEE